MSKMRHNKSGEPLGVAEGRRPANLRTFSWLATFGCSLRRERYKSSRSIPRHRETSTDSRESRAVKQRRTSRLTAWTPLRLTSRSCGAFDTIAMMASDVRLLQPRRSTVVNLVKMVGVVLSELSVDKEDSRVDDVRASIPLKVRFWMNGAEWVKMSERVLGWRYPAKGEKSRSAQSCPSKQRARQDLET